LVAQVRSYGHRAEEGTRPSPHEAGGAALQRGAPNQSPCELVARGAGVTLPQLGDFGRRPAPIGLVKDGASEGRIHLRNPIRAGSRAIVRPFVDAKGVEVKTRTLLALMIACAFPLAAAQSKGKGKKVARDYANTIATLQTDMGDIQIKFFYDKAPKHVENFVDLSAKGFYDGTLFHRVIPGFMIQGGDPNTKSPDKSKHGMGGPGYTIKAEFNERPHKRGILSMARAGHPDSAGSQFFICVKDAAFLDRQYTAFGEVESGMDVADKIVAAPRDRNDNPNDRIEMKVKIVEGK
jgi:peptidyl-prolyl cis-trans isomerase B (cyclophilin B)